MSSTGWKLLMWKVFSPNKYFFIGRCKFQHKTMLASCGKFLSENFPFTLTFHLEVLFCFSSSAEENWTETHQNDHFLLLNWHFNIKKHVLWKINKKEMAFKVPRQCYYFISKYHNHNKRNSLSYNIYRQAKFFFCSFRFSFKLLLGKFVFQTAPMTCTVFLYFFNLL